MFGATQNQPVASQPVSGATQTDAASKSQPEHNVSNKQKVLEYFLDNLHDNFFANLVNM